MTSKYPNKKKREGFWKRYERADIKNYAKVWDVSTKLARKEKIPFTFSSTGRKPNLLPEEIVAMTILYRYCDLDFRETEYMVCLLSGKKLDHTNCVRWFGKITLEYVNRLVFAVHKQIIEIDDVGDYIADSTTLTCNRLKTVLRAGENCFEHETWKMHILIQYIITLGLLSIVSIFSSPGEANDSPFLRERLLKRGKIRKGKKLHADKGYFGKDNIKKCRDLKIIPNIVPKDQEYSDTYLKRYIASGYDQESRKKNRGLVEGVFGGVETQTGSNIRCRKPHHKDLCVGLTGLAHNLRTLFRATALKLWLCFAPTPVG